MTFIKSTKHDSLFFIHDTSDIKAQGVIKGEMYKEDNLNFIDIVLNHDSQAKIHNITRDIQSNFHQQNSYISEYDTFRVHIPIRYGKITIPIETKNNERLLIKDLSDSVVVNIKVKPTSVWIDTQHKLNILFNATHIVANVEYV